MRIILKKMDDTNMFSINPWYDRFFKIISILSFFWILIVLSILLKTGPASSFEFSIYDVYPGYFWIFLLSAIFYGIIVILGSALTHSRKNYWLFGLCAILISNTLLLFLPVIRGYYIYGSYDVLTHIGYMQEILNTFSFGTDHYPIIHLLGVITHLICGLSLPDITLIIPPFFCFFFILSMYFVGKTIFPTTFELLIFVLLSSLLMTGGLAFVPNAQAFFLIPLFLYLAFKMYYGQNTNNYHFLLLLISFLIVLYHPLVTIMMILILCFMQIMHSLQKKYDNRILKKVNYTYTIFFIVAVFSIWSSYLRMATNVVEPIINHLLGDVKQQSQLEKNINLVSKVNVDPLYLIKLILNFYGEWILLGLLALLCIGLIIKSMKNQKTKPGFYTGVSVIGYIVFFILSIALFVSNGSFGFGRVYSFANFFTLFIIPTGVYLFLYNDSPEKSITGKTIIKLVGVIFIIFCVSYFSTFTLFLSPILKGANLQVPRSDYSGMSTFFIYRDESLPTLELGPVSYRFYDTIYGTRTQRNNIFFNSTLMTPPDHFGYQNDTLSFNYSEYPKYLILNDLGRGFYPNIYPEFPKNWKFLAKDFEQLKSDTKIQQVYSNRNLEIFVTLAKRRA